MGKTSLHESVRKHFGKSVVDTLTGSTTVRRSPRKYWKKVLGETPSFDLGVFSQEDKLKKSNSRHAIPVVIDEGSVSKRNGKSIRDDDFEEQEVVLKARKRSKVNHDTKSTKNNKVDPDYGSRKDESDHKFSNIAATSEELELIKLLKKRDYEIEERGDSALHRRNLPFIPENSGVVKNKPDQAILWEVQRLRTAIAKVQSDLDAFRTKVAGDFVSIKEFFTQSINKVLNEIRTSESCQSKKVDVSISPMYTIIRPSSNDRHHHSRYDNACFPDHNEEEVEYATVNDIIKPQGYYTI
ncbi:hypothetical protein A4A49_42571 [Nicotiana attenuata]|uniref:Uncharacterized protein n=1 Tax=Nicotiana attenuata TaxID=49451 RepID=A0A1J6JNE3_NICAT|nr:hypothetical protein A4A49_42571 [Nicotiana attenuata]